MTTRAWLRRGRRPARVLFLMITPWLPLLTLALPPGASGAATHELHHTPIGGRRVSSRGPAGDSVSDRPSTLFSAAEVRRRSAAWEMKRLEGSGWRLLMTKRCAVRGDVRADALRAIGVHADAFLEAIEEALGRDATDLRFSVRVFGTADDFDCYASLAGAKGAASFYDPRMLEAVLRWPAEEGGPPPWRVLMHELAHAYLDRVFDRREPLWLTEGLAEYFASYDVMKGGLARPGGENAASVARIREALEAGSFIPLGRLVRADRGAFYGEAHALHYAEAGSLVTFLARDNPESLASLARGRPIEELGHLGELERCWIERLKEPK